MPQPMTDTAVSISAIVLHYNKEEDTERCLTSLHEAVASTDHKAQICVIDNGSKHPYVLPKRFQDNDSFVLVRSEANLGFTGGNNLGFKTAIKHFDPDYFMLLNADATVAADVFDTLVAHSQNHQDDCLVCPKVYFTPGDEFHSTSYDEQDRGSVLWYAGGVIDTSHLDAFHRGVDELDRGHFDDQKHSDFQTGCCLLIPRKVYEDIGGFDEDYFLYLEDVDLSKRAARAGYRLLFAPDAHVWHDNDGAADGRRGHVSRYYQTRNRLYFFWKIGDIRIKLRVLRVALEKSLNGVPLERQAVIDFLSGRMGKQPVL